MTRFLNADHFKMFITVITLAFACGVYFTTIEARLSSLEKTVHRIEKEVISLRNQGNIKRYRKHRTNFMLL